MYYMVARIYRPVIIFLPIQLGIASKFLSSPHVMVADPFTMYPTSQVTVRVSWNLGKVEEDTLPFFIAGMGHVVSVKVINFYFEPIKSTGRLNCNCHEYIYTCVPEFIY